MSADTESRGAGRVRKQVERFAVEEKAEKPTEITIPEGQGEELGNIPIVEHGLKSAPTDGEGLKALHKALFNKPGTAAKRRTNIKKWKGTDDDDKEAFSAKFEKLSGDVLGEICDILGLSQSGTKADKVSKIADFLVKPEDSGAEPPAAKKRKAAVAASAATKKAPKAKKGKKAGPKRNLTAYMLFANDTRPQVMADHPGTTVPEAGRMLGQMWKESDSKTRKKYEELAKKDKERYEAEKAEWDETHAGDEEEEAPKKKAPAKKAAPKKAAAKKSKKAASEDEAEGSDAEEKKSDEEENSADDE